MSDAELLFKHYLGNPTAGDLSHTPQSAENWQKVFQMQKTNGRAVLCFTVPVVDEKELLQRLEILLQNIYSNDLQVE